MTGLIWLLPAVVLGSSAVFAAAPRLPRRWDSILLQAGLAIGLGFGLASILFFICAASGLNRWIALALEAAAAVALAVSRKKTAITAPPVPQALIPIWMLWIAALLILLISAVAAFELIERNPQGGWDAWAIYNLRAKFLAGPRPAHAWSPELPYTQPGHPLLLSALIAQAWAYSGSFHQWVPIGIAVLFLLGILAVGTGAIGLSRGPVPAILMLISFASFGPLLREAASQYSDVPLSYFMLAAAALWITSRTFESGSFVFLAGACAGFAAWTKDEGLLFTVLMAVLVIVIDRKRLIPFAAGALPILLVVAYFKLVLAPSGAQGGLIAPDLSRLVPIVTAFGREFLALGTGWWHPVAPLIVLALGMGFDAARARQAIPVLSLAVGMLAGYFCVFLFSSEDLDFLLGGSLARLYVQVAPLTMLAFFAALRQPDLLQQRK